MRKSGEGNRFAESRASGDVEELDFERGVGEEIATGDESVDRRGMADMAMGGDERLDARELDGDGACERGSEF